MSCRKQKYSGESNISCLEDVPSVARLAARQQLLARWYHAIALAPFAAVLVIDAEFFGYSDSRLWLVLVGATLIWAFAVAVYTFYLTFFLKCPRCGWRFGSGDKCGSCNLPRHRDVSFCIEGPE
jgi:hypothetical protein